MEDETKTIKEKVKCQVESEICKISEEGIDRDNVEYLGDLIDIHKDLENEEYWKEKKEMYRDRMYNDGSYGRRMRDSRGRYMDMDESYGRRGGRGTGRGHYRGHDMLDEVYETYSDYMDDDSYGVDNMQKIEVMTDSLMDFVEHLKKEAKTPEERQLIDRKLQEIGRM